MKGVALWFTKAGDGVQIGINQLIDITGETEGKSVGERVVGAYQMAFYVRAAIHAYATSSG